MKYSIFFFCALVLSVTSCKKADQPVVDACAKPGFSYITDAPGQLTIAISGGHDFFEIEYGSNGFAKGTGTTVTCNSYYQATFTNGAYDFYVRGNCGGTKWSDWFGPKSVLVQNGTAPVTCSKPTNLRISDIVSGFFWDASGAYIYQVEYGVNGFAHGHGTIAHTNSAHYSDYSLAANTTYDFYVRGICTTGDTSQWAGPFLYFSSNNWRMCLPPTGLNAHRNGGVIEYSFNSNGESSFETVLTTSGGVGNSNPVPSTSTSGAYSGIYSNVTYYFYVRSVCKDGVSKTTWAGPITIN